MPGVVSDIIPRYPAFGKQIANWHVYQKNRDTNQSPNLIGFTIKLDKIDLKIAEQAFEAVVRKHESLRTTFAQTPDGLMQVISPYKRSEHGLSYISCAGREYLERRWKVNMHKIEKVVKNLERGPLFRGTIFEVQNDGAYFEFTVHHALADAWSIQIVREDLFTAYHSYSGGLNETMPPLKRQLKDYALQHYSNDTENKTRAFWLKKLDGLEGETCINALYATYNSYVNTAPCRNIYRSRLMLNTTNLMKALSGGYGFNLVVHVNEKIIQGIGRLSYKYRTTPSIVLLASFLMLSRFLYKTRKPLIISRFNGRLNPESHDLVGNFTSAIYSYIRLERMEKTADLIAVVHEDFREVMNYAIYNPLILKDIPITTSSHLCINILDGDRGGADRQHHAGCDHRFELVKTSKPTYFPIENTVALGEKSLCFNWTYNTTLLRSSMMQFVANEHLKILDKMVSEL